MSRYRDRLEGRDRRPAAPPLPPIGSWVITPRGYEGQVVEHLQRPGREPLARVRHGGSHGAYRAAELRDAGQDVVDHHRPG